MHKCKYRNIEHTTEVSQVHRLASYCLHKHPPSVSEPQKWHLAKLTAQTYYIEIYTYFQMIQKGHLEVTPEAACITPAGGLHCNRMRVVGIV